MLQSLLTPLLQPLLRPPLEVSGGSGLALYLDFLTEYIDPRITYSGGANGTRVNSAGLIVAATTPRFDYNPVTLAPLGFLVEEARTNKATNENANPVTDAAWAIGGDVAATLTVVDDTAALAAAGLNGVCTSGKVYKFDNSAGVGFAFIIQAATTGNTNKHSISVYARTTGTANIEIAGGLGAVNLPVGAAYVRTKSENITPGSSSGKMAIVALAGAVVYFVLNDMEEGAFCTSVIVTAGAAVTRSADSAVMTGTNFSDWFNPAEGTFAPEFTYGGDLVTSTAMSANDNTSNNILEVAGTNSGGVGPYAEVRVGGVVQASMSDGNAIANTTYKTAFRYRANDFSFSHSGRSCVTDAAGTIPSVSQLAIGNRLASSSFNGWIRRLPYYRRGLSDAQLQALSA